MSQFSSPPPGAYQHQTPLGGPPPRQGRPWWVWVLGGCGGCAVLAVITAIVVTTMGVNYFKSEMQNTGPITPQTVKQAMGADVPIYPNSQLNEPASRVMLSTMKLTARMIGVDVRGVGAYLTADSGDKVSAYYRSHLAALGWRPATTRNTGMQVQETYQKGKDGLMLQIQNQNGNTLYFLMRGDAKLFAPGGMGTGSASPP